MEDFLHNNSFWLGPIIGIICTLVLKIANKPSHVELHNTDYLDFGIDLVVAAIIMLVAVDKGATRFYLVIIYVILSMALACATSRIGWGKTGERKLLFLILCDILGITAVVVSALYIGGAIQ